MTTLFISDLHLSQDRPDISERFRAFCRTLPSESDTLFILGDLFEYWIGDDGTAALGLQPHLDELARLSDRGITIRVMHGNRDFLLGAEFAAATGSQLIADPTVVDLYGRRVLLAHGDAYCTDDIEHQQWRTLYLNKNWQQQQLDRSVTERLSMAEQVRETSRQSTKAKSMQIMDVAHTAIRDAFVEHNVDIMIHGHTHRPGLHNYLPTGNPTLAKTSSVTRLIADSGRAGREDDTSAGLAGYPRYRLVLGDWYNQTSCIVATPDEVTLQPGNHVIQNWSLH